MSVPYTIDILASGRAWLTANQRLFWAERSRRTKAWRQAAEIQAVASKIPYIPCALIVCELRFSTSHRRDPANWAPTAKAVVDGLVDAGVFDDDNHKYVTGPDMRIGDVVPEMARGLRVHIHPRKESIRVDQRRIQDV